MQNWISVGITGDRDPGLRAASTDVGRESFDLPELEVGYPWEVLGQAFCDEHSRRSQVVVTGGPYGAWKTSVEPELLHDSVGIDAFVNADVIAQGLAGFRPGSAAVQAGRVMLDWLDELAHTGADFALESTLAGRSLHSRLVEWMGLGYDVHLVYLFLGSPDLAVARVRRRVEAGGHDVPEAVIRRRFWRGLVNFDRLYRPAVTTWRLYDANDLGERPLVAAGARFAAPAIVDGARWERIRSRIEENS